MGENKMVPELRFPIFKNNWEIQSVSSMGEFKGGGTPETEIEEYWKGNIPWISSSDIFEGFIHKISKTRFITQDAINNSATKLIPKGSILMVSRVGVGKFAIADEDLCTSQDFTNLKTKINSSFLAYYFVRDAKEFMKISQGTSIKGYTTKDLKVAKFFIPSEHEQQKIAQFLSRVDQRIQLLEEQKEKLQAYKKGVMQQIFSQQIRFKQEDGSDFPEWKLNKMSHLFQFGQTNSLSRDKLNYEKGDVKNIHYGDIHTKFKSHFYLNKEYVPYINEDVKISILKNVNFVKNGDIILADASEDNIDIGKAIEIIDLNYEKVVSGLHTIHGKLKTDKLEPGFIAYLLQTHNLRKAIFKVSQGTKVLGLSYKKFAEITVELPIRIEQRIIVDFLLNLDRKIDKTIIQIDKTKEFKKGLLQKMFV